MKPEIVLIGGGGHCASCIDVIEAEGKFQIAGIVDREDNLGQKVLGYEIIACDDQLPELSGRYEHFLVTLGQIKTPARRKALFTGLESRVNFPTIVSPRAWVSPHASVGRGTIVMHHAIINARARVGDNCIINSGALVEHDAVIGSHSHISTAAVVNGNVEIGEGVFLGSNAVCREAISIGARSVIGFGSTVARSVAEGSWLK